STCPWRAWRRWPRPGWWTGSPPPTRRWRPAPRWPRCRDRRPPGPSRRPADPRLLQHRGVHAELPPGGVGDPLALAVGPGGLDEALLELDEIHLGLVGLQLGGEVQALLDELEPLQGVGILQLGLDAGQPLLDGLWGPLAAPAGLVSVERLQVPAHRTALIAALGERRLV